MSMTENAPSPNAWRIETPGPAGSDPTFGLNAARVFDLPVTR